MPMIELLSFPFFQNALIVGLLASLVCGIIGCYVVVKKMSYISGSIAHTAFGGLGLSYWLQFNPLLGAMGFGAIAAFLMGLIRYKLKQQEDALIGAIWAIGMSLGIICLSLGTGYAGNLFDYLFGNILLTTSADITLMIALAIVLLIIVGIFYRPFQAISFDEDYAKILNLPVFFLYSLLLQLITITIIILLKVVGIIMVIALLTLPASAAKNWCKKLLSMMIISTLIGAVSMIGGLCLGYYTDLPPSPLIILICASLFIISLVTRKT